MDPGDENSNLLVGGPEPPEPPFPVGEAVEDELLGDVELPGVDDLPLFANEEAVILHSEIKKEKGKLERSNREHSEHAERLSIMQEHLRNVTQEVQHTTSLVNSKKKEIEAEDHLKQLAIRESGRYRQELKRLQTQLEETDGKLNAVQNSIFKGNEMMDQFKLQMNWNQEELEQWALAAKQKEEDNLALQRYTRADEVKIKELNLQIEKLTKTLVEKKASLEGETTETKARQIELDRTAEEFRALHSERQQLVRQWQDAIEATNRRDVEINQVAQSYMEERARRQERDEQLQINRDHLKGIIDDNNEVESKTLLLERQVQARRADLMSARDRLQEFKDELEVLKNELTSGAASLMKKRSENDNLLSELEERKIALDACRKKFQGVKRRLESSSLATDKVEASAKNAEYDLKSNEVNMKKQEGTLGALKESMFKQSQALFALRQEEANLIAEISGAQAQARNLQAKIRQLDQESMRQQELIYNAEFQIQQMERKVARGLGERSDDEKKKLNAEIKVLEDELEGCKDKKKMLVTQCRKLNNELRAAERRQELAVKQRGELEARITELELENTSAEQSLKSFVMQKEEAMVQNDVMRLELKRLRDTLNARTDKVFALENRREQLTLSMEERKREIAVHQEVQRAQVRAAEEERHKVQLEVGMRRQAVEKLRAKYETLVKASGSGEGEDGGETKSQAYYLIQAAQRREELQREGDELDQEIRKREKEIRALEHTLDHLNLRNGEFRKSFQKADMNSSDADDLAQLEEQAKLAQDALFRRKKELQRLQTDYEEDQRRLEQVEQQGSRLEERNGHLNEAKMQMEAELEAQRDNLDKTQRRLERLIAAHREKEGAMEETLYEKDFRSIAMRDTSQNVLFTLGELSKAYPEIKDMLQSQLQKAKLGIPARPASRPARGGRQDRLADADSELSDDRSA